MTANGTIVAGVDVGTECVKAVVIDAEGRLLVNTPYETAELYAMFKAPNRGELEFGS